MSQPDPRFISDLRQDYPSLADLSSHLTTGYRRWIPRACCLLIFVLMIRAFLTDPSALTFYCCVYFAALGITYFLNRDGGSKYRKFLAENGGIPKRNLVYLHEDLIRYRNPETENTVEYPYSRIRRIRKTRLHYALTLDDGTGIAINHATLTGGTPAQLEQFLLERTGIQKIEKPLDNRIFRKILTVFMALMLVLSLLRGGVLPSSGPKTMSAGDAAQVLTELGIDPPSDEMLEELAAYGADEYTFQSVLFESGCGSYDFDTWEWTPARSGVYAFDLEVFELSRMYTNFLHGVSAMSRGTLEFTDIIEDDSQVDFENGSGTKTVTFTFRNKTYTLRPAMMNDWFDPDFANELARIVGRDADGRRLWFHYDGYQMAAIFYADADWARSFERTTGCQLTDSLF